jgi:preprotein translocase subunit SecY
MFGKSRYNFWLDLSILTAFLVTAVTGLLLWLVLPHGPGSQSSVFLGLTRYAWIDIHDWAGLAMLLGAATHIALHWKWISCVAGRYFKRLARQARINFSLNSLLFIAFFLASLSGLVAWLVLPGGGYQGGRNPFYNATLLGLTRHGWNDIHLWTGLAMIVVLTVHFALHWNWLTFTARRYAQAAVSNWHQTAQPDECTV